MRIEIISIPGCPNHEPTLERVKALLRSEALLADVREILVNDGSAARTLAFSGSPTVRVNGKDVEPFVPRRGAVCCRIYADGTGVPPDDLLKLAIRSAEEADESRR